jgi:hypothetical protein
MLPKPGTCAEAVRARLRPQHSCICSPLLLLLVLLLLLLLTNPARCCCCCCCCSPHLQEYLPQSCDIP